MDEDEGLGAVTDLRLGALVLAAGAGHRFGGDKLIAELDGRPLLQHVLDTVTAVRPVVTLVVIAAGMRGMERLAWHGARRLVNPEPERGLSSSVRLGLEASARRARRGRRLHPAGRPAEDRGGDPARAGAGGLTRARGWCRRGRPGLRRGWRREPGPAAASRLRARGAARWRPRPGRPDRRHDRGWSAGCRCPAPTRTWTPWRTCRRCKASPTGRWTDLPGWVRRSRERRSRPGWARDRRGARARCRRRCFRGRRRCCWRGSRRRRTGIGEGEARLMSASVQAVSKSAVQMSAVVSGPNASCATMVVATDRVPAIEPSVVTATPVSSSDGMSAVPLLTGVVVRLVGSPLPVARPQATTAASCASSVGGAKVVSSCWSMRTCWTPGMVATPPVTCRVAGSMLAALSPAMTPAATASSLLMTASKPSAPTAEMAAVIDSLPLVGGSWR